MASNLHKDLSDSQLHYPKGFATASNGTQLIKNASGNLEWATASAGGVTQIVAGTNVTISPTGGTGAVTINATGEECGLMKAIDVGHFNTGLTFGRVPFSGALDFTDCSGDIGTMYELEIGLAYTRSGVDGVIGDVWLKVELDTGQLITANANSLGTQPRDCGSCAEDTGVCYMYGFWKLNFPISGTKATRLNFKLGSGCEDYTIIPSSISQASYISLKEFCRPFVPQIIGGKSGGGESPKK